MITRIPRSSFSANINNTAQTNEHQTLSELFYKELEDKFSGKELATPLLKSFSENCRQNGRHIFSNKDFVIKFSTSVLQADKKEITIINKNENTTLTQTIAPIFEEYLMEILPQRSDTLDKQELNLKSDRKEKEFPRIKLNGQCYFHNILMIFIRMLITNPIKMITLQLKNFSRTSTKNAKTRLWRWFPAVLRGVTLLPVVISG